MPGAVVIDGPENRRANPMRFVCSPQPTNAMAATALS